MKRRNRDLIGLSATVAFCGMLYELVLAQSMAAVWGGTLARYQFTIGVYLAAMGLGAYLASLAPLRRKAWESLWIIELALAIAGGLTPLLCVELGRFNFVGPWAYAPWIVLIGMLGGAELPLLMEIGQRREPGRAGVAAPILAADYVGMLIASTAFVVWLLPHSGLFGTAWLAGALNALAALATIALAPKGTRSLNARSIAAVATALVIALQFAALRQTPRLQTLIVERAYLAGISR